ncbi:alpha/beta fold hydrolase [Streptantibioticus cattleyicolor]|uniref:Alpha/beta hydrolase fold protein n=1 Tax=Streptantibioticus cattleyicolor (strain ATCC 35852 / DSM 46488 / JCM 4925 / NBRC 14057 / NRRL 8057) TaxID=1003195 RepID=F8JK16_STREN|nr:alpha/beta hydrolase [Streptantibioticus cattleyicolor]AEW99848.1 alpha/beta hydrolase fold protein [Streptantibioticus cattleyicolor NRRL 8057 = DSM 46488]CCB71115.1 Predicted hydrolase or acyltransferase of alpha/beta superfamily [Streptantibioticus cattleyicolor NRRL 8057 = DSM 46488]
MTPTFDDRNRVATPVLDIAYEQAGERTPGAGVPVILLHGFPYDVRAFDEVAARLAARGRFVLAPYLRGFGPTAFRHAETMRSGQQAALGQDLLDFMDALGIERAVVAGYDWGGRAACVAAAAWPERIQGLVTAGGYTIQDIARAMEPAAPEAEHNYWYQYYFHSERGRRGLERNREELCGLLWRLWSPTWRQAGEAFAASAASLHNPDFVDVAIHSYRHRYGLVAGDPRHQALEDLLAGRPRITVPTVVLVSGANGVIAPADQRGTEHFTGPCDLRTLPGIGHNVPQEAPEAFAEAILSLPS